MTQIQIRLPSGLEVRFEGDADAFERFAEFLGGDFHEFLGKLGTETLEEGEEGEDGEDTPPPPQPRDIRELDVRLATSAAQTDVERVAVMAHFAVESGLGGLSPAQAEAWYRQLGLRLPGRMRSTFSNAAQRGYIHNVGRGVWQATSAGHNFATRGERRPAGARTRRNRSGVATS